MTGNRNISPRNAALAAFAFIAIGATPIIEAAKIEVCPQMDKYSQGVCGRCLNDDFCPRNSDVTYRCHPVHKLCWDGVSE